MCNSFYKCDDGSEKNEEDFIYFISVYKYYFPERENWSFDQITGGIDNFTNVKSYLKMKDYFNNIENL